MSNIIQYLPLSIQYQIIIKLNITSNTIENRHNNRSFKHNIEHYPPLSIQYQT